MQVKSEKNIAGLFKVPVKITKRTTAGETVNDQAANLPIVEPMDLDIEPPTYHDEELPEPEPPPPEPPALCLTRGLEERAEEKIVISLKLKGK